MQLATYLRHCLPQFVVVIWGAQDFLCLFIISNPCVDPGPLPKKYEGRIMELWAGEKSNCHFYGLCYKDSRPREFQVSCLWLVHCMFVVDTCVSSSRSVNVTKDAHHEENEITWGPWHFHVLHVANSIRPQTNILWEHCQWLCWMHHHDMSSCLSNFERKSLNMRSNSEGCFPEFLMNYWWSFDAVLMQFWNCIKMMQFWCSFKWKVMQFWCSFKTASKLHQNCVRTASCFWLNFHILSSQKIKIWRPNDWLEIRIWWCCFPSPGDQPLWLAMQVCSSSHVVMANNTFAGNGHMLYIYMHIM